jgi:hypothetical protein
MSVLLFVVGALATLAGVGMVGYGIPINEFSFGNTLIIAGTTAAVGGLLIIGIGAVVSQLQRLAETLATRAPVRSSRPFEKFEPAAGSRAAPMPGQIPFPSRPKSEAGVREPQPAIDALAPADMEVENRAGAPVAPTLRNPDMPTVVVEEYEIKEYEDVSLSPRQPMPAPTPTELGEPAPAPPVSVNASPMAEKRLEPEFDAPFRFAPPPASPPQERQPQTNYFDTMWPAESRPAKRPVVDEPKPEPPSSAMAAAPEAANSHQASEPPVAILKSGVVDGMGYTLYVDGSIEAELPQGTLRFASINELREHLTKNS